MKFETIKIIAAFGGFALGIINIAITIYKEFIKSSKLYIEIEKASIRCVSKGEYDFQLNISFSAKNGSIHLKNIIIEHPLICIKQTNTNQINANTSVTFIKNDLLEKSPDDFRKIVVGLFENPITIRDLKIENTERKSLTFAGRVQTKNGVLCTEKFPLKNWNLLIEYDDKKLAEKINFDKHVNGRGEYWA